MAGDVADDGTGPARRQGEDVVPVAADAQVVARHVTGGQIQAGKVWQPAGQQAALQGQGCLPVEDLRAGLPGEAGPIGGSRLRY